MKLSQEALIDLMALADGELDGPDRERVEQLVAEDENARQIVESMRRPDLGAWLEEGVDARARRAGVDGIADAVMATLAAAPTAPAVAAAPVEKKSSAPPPGIVRITRRRPARSSRLEWAIGGGVAALALAAGVALYMHSHDGPLEEGAPVASVGVPPVDFQAPMAAANPVGPANGVELDEIDAPSRGVSVFEIPGSAAAAIAPAAGMTALTATGLESQAPPGSPGSSIVVWVDEDPGPK